MLSLKEVREHNVLGRLLAEGFISNNKDSSEKWIWKNLFKGRSDIFFQMNNDYVGIHCICVDSGDNQFYRSNINLFHTKLKNDAKRTEEDTLNAFIEKFEINAAIVGAENANIIEGRYNIKEYFSSITDSDRFKQTLYLTNNSKSLNNYRRNKEILASIDCLKVNTRHILYFQNLSDVMFFTIKAEDPSSTQIADTYGWKGVLRKSYLDVVSCLTLYGNNDNIIVIEVYKDEGKEFGFSYKRMNDDESYVDFIKSLSDDKYYCGIMYNPIFYNTIHHALIAAQNNALNLDMQENINKNIREAMYGDNILVKKW